MKFKLIVLLLTVFLVGCAETYEYEKVVGLVVYKEYDPAGYKTKKVMNFEGEYETKKVYESEEYEIIVSYEGLEKEFEFNDDDIFNQYEVGKEVPLLLEKGFDAEGTLVYKNIKSIGGQ